MSDGVFLIKITSSSYHCVLSNSLLSCKTYQCQCIGNPKQCLLVKIIGAETLCFFVLIRNNFVDCVVLLIEEALYDSL